MRRIEIDLANIETVRALHIYLAYMLDLPAHYGRNLDALHDCLIEIGEETELVVHAQGAAGENIAYLPKLVRVLEDAALENEKLSAVIF